MTSATLTRSEADAADALAPILDAIDVLEAVPYADRDHDAIRALLTEADAILAAAADGQRRTTIAMVALRRRREG